MNKKNWNWLIPKMQFEKGFYSAPKLELGVAEQIDLVKFKYQTYLVNEGIIILTSIKYES